MDNVIDLKERAAARRLKHHIHNVSRFYGSADHLLSALLAQLSLSREVIQQLPPGVARYALEFQCAKLSLAVTQVQMFASDQVTLAASAEEKAGHSDPSSAA